MKTSILIILAGPNGAGKSTFYRQYLANSGYEFVNADAIAADRFGPRAAAHAREAQRLADETRKRYVAEGRSFIFETVLSDPVGDKVAFFAQAKAAGYFLEVHFIGLASSALSQARVIGRVARGGHDVPDDKLRDRFPRTLANLVRLLDVADRLTIYDNSEIARPHRAIALLENGTLLAIADPLPVWLKPVDLESRRTDSTQPL